jgi:hypothetical protein
MGVLIGGRTGQLLCMRMDGAVALYGVYSVMLMHSGCLVPINSKNGFWDALGSVLVMQYGCSYWWQNRAVVVCGDGWRRCNMGVPVGRRTGQLLCVGMMAVCSY